MIDVRKSDRKTLSVCMINPGRLWYLFIATGISWLSWSLKEPVVAVAVAVITIGVYGYLVYEDFKKARWKNEEHRMLWTQIVERWKRLRKALNRAPEFARDSLSNTPQAIENTARQLFTSLRKADLVKAEIISSESNLSDPRLRLGMRSSDAETTELYSLADKNVAEYRKLYERVASRVTRVEAQCAVFSSALDSLRMKLLGYRLLSKDQPEPSAEFGQVVSDIKSQLAGIDAALCELELYPELQVEPE